MSLKVRTSFFILSISNLLSMNFAYGLDCLDGEDKNRGISNICFLENQDTRIELHYAPMGCEYPEGNKQDCAYVSACQKDKSYNQKGRQVYRKDIDLESFCTSAKNYKIAETQVLATLSGTSSNRKAKAYFLCPFKKHKSVLLVVGDKQKKCNLPF